MTKTLAFSIKESIITTLYSDIDTILNLIVRNLVSDFLFLIELKNNSKREILNNGEEIPVDMKMKQKREEENSATPATHNLKQMEGIPDLWHLPEGVKFDSLFGDDQKKIR